MSSTQYRSFPLNVPPQLMYHGYIIHWKQVPINVPWYINRRQSFVQFECQLIGLCYKSHCDKAILVPA